MSREEYLREIETLGLMISAKQKEMINSAVETYKQYDDAMEKLGYPNKIKNTECVCSTSDRKLF